MLTAWSWILIASIALGVFFLVLLLFGRKSNPQATYLFSGLLFLLIAVNFDNWLYASGVWEHCPMLMGFSRGTILLFGPLIYFYTRSIITQEFRLSYWQLLHLFPFLIVYVNYIPILYLQDEAAKRMYIEYGFSGEPNLDWWAYLTFTVYLVHVSVYLLVTLRLILKELQTPAKVSYIVPTEERLHWAKTLTIVFSLCILVLVALFAWAFATQTYHAEINFIMTSAYTVLIYYLGFGIVRNEHLLFPGFARKYQTLNLTEEQRKQYISKLIYVIEQEKIYLDPELTLAKTAEAVGIQPGHLSKLINEEHGKNFSDFINHFRIEEIKKRLKDSQYDNLSIFGVALETGFNSKSSFNSAFKKATGMTPSDYKKN